jgi:hypothetical protein
MVIVQSYVNLGKGLLVKVSVQFSVFYSTYTNLSFLSLNYYLVKRATLPSAEAVMTEVVILQRATCLTDDRTNYRRHLHAGHPARSATVSCHIWIRPRALKNVSGVIRPLRAFEAVPELLIGYRTLSTVLNRRERCSPTSTGPGGSLRTGLRT